MQRYILLTLFAATLSVITGPAATAQSVDFTPNQEVPGVQIPDQGSVLIGGILASPEVYFRFFPTSGSVILQGGSAGHFIIELGNELSLMAAIDRPINDADNRPPMSWSALLALIQPGQ